MNTFLLATAATARTGWRTMLPEPSRLGEIAVRLAVTLVFAFIIQRLLFLVVSRLEQVLRRAHHHSEGAHQRSRTIGGVMRNIITTLVGAAVLVRVLAILGWDVRPLLAGAGIVGVALGFGAQTLVRDVIAGIFILIEDQFSVGDLIEISGRAATVEAITLRSTTLRDFNGYVHYVPNGEMKVVTNRSRGWQRLAVDVPIAADQNLDEAIDVCRRVIDQMNADVAWRDQLLDPIDLWGVETLGPSEAMLRIVVRALPGPGAAQAARELRQRVHRALVAASIRTSSSRDITLTPMSPAGDAGETPAFPSEPPPGKVNE